MQSPAFAVGLACALVLGSCAHPTCRPVTPLHAHTRAGSGDDSKIDPSRAFPNWRFIGRKANVGASCPQISGWTTRPLFENPAPPCDCIAGEAPAALQSEARPEETGKTGADCRSVNDALKEMNQFCLYETERHGRVSPPTSPYLTRIDPDPVVLSLAGKKKKLGLEQTIQPRLAAHFFEQVGRTGVRLSIDDKKPKVRLAFLDTQPNGNGVETPPGRSPHGDFLRFVGHALTCEDGRCATDITTRLALPIVRFDPKSKKHTVRDEECGGYIGSLGDLAQAIRGEVDEWLGEDQYRPLVMNLSLAWDGELFRELPEMVAGQQAVFSALEYAAAHGALVFVAAGNSKSGPGSSTGPLLPAAWEIEGLAGSPVDRNQQGPVVYAVGGVGSNGLGLANSRPGGMPGLVAYADHAALGIFSPPRRHMSTYTGSSVAAAVVSSIAALVWYERPELDAGGVLEILRAIDDHLGSADFSSGHDGPSEGLLRTRISLCKALKAAGAIPDSCCPNLKPTPLLLSDLLSGGSKQVTFTTLTAPDSVLCQADRLLVAEPAPHLKEAEICPERFHDISSLAWVYPQPGIDPCPNCEAGPPRNLSEQANGRYVLYIEIREDWPDDKMKLESATLYLETPGLTPAPLPFVIQGVRGLTHGSLLDVTLPDELKFGEGSSAILDWVMRDTGTRELFSVRSPVFIAR